MLALLDPELLFDFELLLFPEPLGLELESPLNVDALEPPSAPLLAAPAVPDDELPPALDACAPNSTLNTALLTWPDEFGPVALELGELAVGAAEFDGVLASADACVVSVADVLLAVFVLSSVKSALVALDELAPVTDICCSLETFTRIDTVLAACLNRISQAA